MVPATSSSMPLINIRFRALVRLHVQHHIADPTVGLKILSRDIDLLPGKDAVDFRRDPALIPVNIQSARLVWVSTC